MNRPLLILLVTLALAASAVGAIVAWGNRSVVAPDSATPLAPSARSPGDRSPEVLGASLDRSAADANRREVNALVENVDDADQGVSGWVIDPNGLPLAGVPVYLVENQLSNTRQRFLLAQQGVRLPPTVQALTDEGGRFRIGVRNPAGKTFDVCAVHEAFADERVSRIVIQEGDWSDLGALRLGPGVVVRGRVAMAGSGVPIAGAKVALRRSSTLDLVRIPGREDGHVAHTDGGGWFEIPNAPRGLADVSAEAEGFASVLRRGIDLQSGEAATIEFELQRGLGMLGSIVDPDGHPVVGARIRALSLDPKVNQTVEAFSNDGGAFTLADLHPQQFQLVVEAPGFQSLRHGPVQAGTTGLQLTLQPKGAAWVLVSDPTGSPVREFRFVPRQHFASSGQVGQVQGVAARQVGPRDLDRDRALVRGLDDGSYVFEVSARGFAKSFSAPFSVSGGAPPPTVEVVLAPGAELSGEVLAADGTPLVGATVRVRADGSAQNPMFATMLANAPQRTTDARTRTTERGRYLLRHLAPGRYQMEIDHPEFCSAVVRAIDIAGDETLSLDPTTLARGVRVGGTATYAGTPRGQLKIALRPEAEGGRSFEAITTSRGLFEFGERVPPGRYSLSAARQTTGDVFSTILDAKRSQRPVSIAAAPATLSLAIDIPAQ